MRCADMLMLIQLYGGGHRFDTRECPLRPISSFRCLAKFGRYGRHSGHWLRLGLDASVANDPKPTTATEV